MDRKIVFIHSGTVRIRLPTMVGGGNEPYFFLGPKMIVFVLHRGDIDEM